MGRLIVHGSVVNTVQIQLLVRIQLAWRGTTMQIGAGGQLREGEGAGEGTDWSRSVQASNLPELQDPSAKRCS